MFIFCTIPYVLPAAICVLGLAGITSIFSFIADHQIITSILFAPFGIISVIVAFVDDECLGVRIYNAITCTILQISLLLFVFGVSRTFLSEDAGLFTIIVTLFVSMLEILIHLWWMTAINEYGPFGKIVTGTGCAIFGLLLGLAMMGY